MIRSFFPPLLLVLAPPAAALAAQADGSEPVQLAQLMIHERITIRLPRIAPDPPPMRALPPVDWRETGGPKCIAPAQLTGAAVSKPGTIDLMMNDGGRMRARLDGTCQALDYYSGFYIRAGADGRVCARRESIRARTGETCPIAAFRKLKPARGRHRLP